MDTFTALAEPTRRTIVEMLAERGALPAMEIGKRFRATPAAISQHLKVLREAKVLRMRKQGRQRIYEVDPAAMEEVEAWAAKTKQMWNDRFDMLEKVLKAEKHTSAIKHNHGNR